MAPFWLIPPVRLPCTHKSAVAHNLNLGSFARPHPSPPLGKGRELVSSLPPYQGGIKGGHAGVQKESELYVHGSLLKGGAVSGRRSRQGNKAVVMRSMFRLIQKLVENQGCFSPQGWGAGGAFLLLLLASPSAFAQTNQGRVLLTLDPPATKLLPFEAEAEQQQSPPRFHLEAQDSQGKALSRVRMQIKMVTPEPNPWISTDFPIVEGTELLSLEVPAAQGVVEFEQMLPIRGAYQVFVKVLPMDDAKATPLIEKVLTVDVPENPVKFRNFAILAGICTLVGAVGGFFIGQPQERVEDRRLRPGIPDSVRLLLLGLTLTAMAALIFINVSAEFQGGHSPMPGMANTPPMHAPLTAQDKEQVLNLDGIKEARVGRAESFQAKLADRRTGQEIPSAFEVSVINTENNWKLFSIATPITNHMRWRQQFFDGSGHRIEVQTPPHTKQTALTTKHSVSVEGIAPPVSVRLKALAYLTGFVALGLFGTMGLKLRSSRTRVSS
jgi:hypothetical protein